MIYKIDKGGLARDVLKEYNKVFGTKTLDAKKNTKMSKDNLILTNAGNSEKIDPTVDDELNNDEYYTAVVSNELTAQLFFSMFLSPTILERIDLSTLRTMHTRDVDPNGVVTIGDVFFAVDMKDRAGKKKRRAVFVIVSEHKLKDDPYVAIQLLGYVAALFKRMSGEKDEFADENGRLPAPYPILFSQDDKPKNPPPYLSEIVWNIEGLEEFVPFFKFQTIHTSEIPLETIKSCEPVMRTFLHLTKIANLKHTSEEDAELAETFRLLLDKPESDERARQCAIASFHYFAHLQKKRPGMMTLPKLKTEIAKQKGGSMDKYDGLYLFFGKEMTERYEKGRDDCIYNTIYRSLRVKFNDKSISKRLREKIDSINYYPALEEVQDAVLTEATLVAFGRKVNAIIKKYEVEIKESRR